LNAVAWIDSYVGSLGPHCCGPVGVEDFVPDLQLLICREKRLSVIAGVRHVHMDIQEFGLRGR
jgi:hypothetical protein